MGDVVNLRRVRKERARMTRERDAEANRLKFGRTKAERQNAGQEHLKQIQSIDGHRLEGGGDSSSE